MRKKKEFIKLHIAVDTRSEKIVFYRVPKGNVHDFKEFNSMVREVSEEYYIDKVYADKAHDIEGVLTLLDDLNIRIYVIDVPLDVYHRSSKKLTEIFLRH
ncbi:MAG: transposase [Nitrososphaeraceae archaeon]